MTTVLVFAPDPAAAHLLSMDLESVGMKVLAVVSERSKLVQEALRQTPELLICHDAHPSGELFKAIEVIIETAPCPVMFFTSNSDADNIVRATTIGIHAYVVSGYAQHRLRPLLHLAQARFKHAQALRAELQDITSRFEERKMVDRAKGILMRARQLSDDDAFQMLRTVSMHSNQRLGQVSQQIIHAAHFAEAVNRSGQLRMLSQRIAKLHLLHMAGLQTAAGAQLLADSMARIDANLALLGKSLSKATFGDLLGQVSLTWSRLKQALRLRATPDTPAARQASVPLGYEALDEMAEQLLLDAERLTANLENAGSVPPLHVLNVAGRQRMLSQRFAKYALLGVAGEPGELGPAMRARREAGMAESRAAFDSAMAYLKALPLSTQDIRSGLDDAASLWAQLVACAGQSQPQGQGRATTARSVEQLAQLEQASEGLLDAFERLSDQYEHSMHMLVGS